jgi:hypothetical protein
MGCGPGDRPMAGHQARPLLPLCFPCRNPLRARLTRRNAPACNRFRGRTEADKLRLSPPGSRHIAGPISRAQAPRACAWQLSPVLSPRQRPLAGAGCGGVAGLCPSGRWANAARARDGHADGPIAWVGVAAGLTRGGSHGAAHGSHQRDLQRAALRGREPTPATGSCCAGFGCIGAGAIR